MTLQIKLNDSEALALQQRAQALGQEFSDYVGCVLRREAKRSLRTLQQIAADVEQRRGAPLGMTEDEIGDMLEAAKHEMRAERNQRASQ